MGSLVHSTMKLPLWWFAAVARNEMPDGLQNCKMTGLLNSRSAWSVLGNTWLENCVFSKAAICSVSLLVHRNPVSDHLVRLSIECKMRLELMYTRSIETCFWFSPGIENNVHVGSRTGRFANLHRQICMMAFHWSSWLLSYFPASFENDLVLVWLSWPSCPWTYFRSDKVLVFAFHVNFWHDSDRLLSVWPLVSRITKLIFVSASLAGIL